MLASGAELSTALGKPSSGLLISRGGLFFSLVVKVPPIGAGTGRISGKAGSYPDTPNHSRRTQTEGQTTPRPGTERPKAPDQEPAPTAEPGTDTRTSRARARRRTAPEEPPGQPGQATAARRQAEATAAEGNSDREAGDETHRKRGNADCAAPGDTTESQNSGPEGERDTRQQTATKTSTT